MARRARPLFCPASWPCHWQRDCLVPTLTVRIAPLRMLVSIGACLFVTLMHVWVTDCTEAAEQGQSTSGGSTTGSAGTGAGSGAGSTAGSASGAGDEDAATWCVPLPTPVPVPPHSRCTGSDLASGSAVVLHIDGDVGVLRWGSVLARVLCGRRSPHASCAVCTDSVCVSPYWCRGACVLGRYPRARIDIAREKLSLGNPVEIMCKELSENTRLIASKVRMGGGCVLPGLPACPSLD